MKIVSLFKRVNEKKGKIYGSKGMRENIFYWIFIYYIIIVF